MSDALVMAINAGFDVLNALDLMENKTFLEPLKFGMGDGIIFKLLILQMALPGHAVKFCLFSPLVKRRNKVQEKDRIE